MNLISDSKIQLAPEIISSALALSSASVLMNIFVLCVYKVVQKGLT